MANSVSHNFPVRLIWGEAFGLDGRPGAMGVNGGMPWRLSPDLRYFKAMTIACEVRIWQTACHIISLCD